MEFGSPDDKKKKFIVRDYNDIEYSDIGRVLEYSPEISCGQYCGFVTKREDRSAAYDYKLTKVYETSRFVTNYEPVVQKNFTSTRGRYRNLEEFHSTTITHADNSDSLRLFGSSVKVVDMPNLSSCVIMFYDMGSISDISSLNIPKCERIECYNFYWLRDKTYEFPSLKHLGSWNFEYTYNCHFYMRKLERIDGGFMYGGTNSHLYLGSNPPEIGDTSKVLISSHSVHIPKGSMENYTNDPTWVLLKSQKGFTLVEDDE